MWGNILFGNVSSFRPWMAEVLHSPWVVAVGRFAPAMPVNYHFW